MLYAKMVTSSYAHARIMSVEVSEALVAPRVQAVLTGKDFSGLSGVVLEDRSPLARDKVRYFGEPVALVVANSDTEATRAAKLVKVVYEPLPIVNSVIEALAKNAPLIHPGLAHYRHAVQDVYPEPGSNVCHRVNIIKGACLSMTE